MIFLREPQIEKAVDCPYIKGKQFIQENFYAYQLTENEYDEFLSAGWRRFGFYFFRPVCNNCCKCIPLRLICSDFKASKSQRRVLKKNINTEVRMSLPRYSDQLFELYRKHSKEKFGQDSDVFRFRESFFTPAVPSAQSEYYIDGKLIGAGFIDISRNAFSSVYFIYDTDYSSYSPGVFSVLKEIEIGKELGVSYYNLGYWIKENSSMSYKGNYTPYQTYNWKEKVWYDGDCYRSDESEKMTDKEDIKT